MKIFILIMIVSLMLFIPACGWNKPTLTKEETTVITDAGNEIKTSADKIDGIVDGSEYEQPVKVETDNIREEVKKLSYEEIEALYKPKFNKLENDLKNKDKTISGLQKIIKDLKDEVEKLQNYVQSQQYKLLTGISVGLLVLTGILVYLRQINFAGLSGVTAVSILGAAQIINSWWFAPALALLVATVIILSVVLFYKQKVKDETAVKIMSVLEGVYNNETPENKKFMDDKIFDELSRTMDKKHKEIVKGTKLD